MFSPTKVVIDAFVEELARGYTVMYGHNARDLQLIVSSGRRSLEIIANSDVPYHDLNHTALVTLVGQEILRGKATARGCDHPIRVGTLHRLTAASRHRLCPGHLPRRSKRALRHQPGYGDRRATAGSNRRLPDALPRGPGQDLHPRAL